MKRKITYEYKKTMIPPHTLYLYLDGELVHSSKNHSVVISKLAEKLDITWNEALEIFDTEAIKLD